ncbi:MAG: alpha/beta hydrolase [Deltaproteobacteria bacterium]|nr:alpha/beta hydrolase [Deltaproteobacteria bacterium]
MKKFFGYALVVVAAIVVLLALFYFLFPKSVFKLSIDAQRRSAGLVMKEVRVDDHRIVYLEGGKGETIVLLHGFGSSKDAWTAFAKYMKGYHLLIPDLPGFGESSQVPADRYDIESQVGRIDRLVEALKLDKFHMAGNSMGGAYTATYGAKYPGKIITLALMDTAGALSRNKSEFVMQWEKGNNLLLSGNTEDFDALMALIFVKRPPIPASLKKIMIEDWIARAEFNRKIWNDWQPHLFSLAPVLLLIQAPVLIIWGDQDKIVDMGGVAFLEKNLRKYRTVIMKETGHCPMMEKPEETAKVYRSFLMGQR